MLRGGVRRGTIRSIGWRIMCAGIWIWGDCGRLLDWDRCWGVGRVVGVWVPVDWECRWIEIPAEGSLRSPQSPPARTDQATMLAKIEWVFLCVMGVTICL